MEPNIRNCTFRYACPRDWDQLQETKRDGIRYCDSCHANVYLCETNAQLLRHMLSHHCVAIPTKLRQRDQQCGDDTPPRQTWLGEPDMGLREDLAQITGRPVDGITLRGIRNPLLLESLRRDAGRLYAA